MPVARVNSAPSNPVPAGMHHAVCYGVIDLGTQQPLPGSMYATGPSHNVLLQFEIPDERIDLERDGKKVNLPRAISKEFKLSLHEKANLRKFLVAWRGKQFTPEELHGFDVANVLGVNCMLNIVHTEKGDKTFANINSVGPLVRGMEKKVPENPAVKYEITDAEIPASVPAWIQKKIMQADEKRVPTKDTVAHSADQLPDSWGGAPAEEGGEVPF